MGNFKKKPVVIEAITWDELVKYGLENSDNIVEGMAWSFEYKGHQITHENDECYIIPTLEGNHNMTPKDVLITGVRGEIYPCKVDIFKETYDEVVVPSTGDEQSEPNETTLKISPSGYDLTECLKELKFNRPAAQQKLLQKWIEELDGRQEQTFSRSVIEQLQTKIHKITGDGDVMVLFNELLGNNAG